MPQPARRLSLLPLLAACHMLAQSADAPADAAHRLDYPAEHFSIELPAAWKEVDPAIAEKVGASARIMFPNGSNRKFNHLYTVSDLSSRGLGVLQSDEQPSESVLKDLDSLSRAANSAAARFAFGSAIQNTRIEDVSYDRERHLLLAITSATSVLTGEIKQVSGAYITRVGSIQLMCYSKASDFANAEQECRKIIKSVAIDPRVTIGPATPDSELMTLTTEQANARYRRLVDRAKSGDLSIDFHELRIACARSGICDTRATPAELGEMSRAASEHRDRVAVDLADKLIDRGFINIEAHVLCVELYAKLRMPEEAKAHQTIMTALLRSIMDRGDGKTEDSAYEVISMREEYVMLMSRQLPYFGEGVSSSYVTRNGHHYTRWEIRDPKTQQNVVIFFNIDAIPR